MLGRRLYNYAVKWMREKVYKVYKVYKVLMETGKGERHGATLHLPSPNLCYSTHPPLHSSSPSSNTHPRKAMVSATGDDMRHQSTTVWYLIFRGFSLIELHTWETMRAALYLAQ